MQRRAGFFNSAELRLHRGAQLAGVPLDLGGRLRLLLELPPGLIDLERFARDRNLTAEEQDGLVARLSLLRLAGGGRTFAVLPAAWTRFGSEVKAALTAFHAANPDQPGIPANRLRADLSQVLSGAGLTPPLVSELAARFHVTDARALEVLQGLAQEGSLVRAGELFFDAKAIGALEQKVIEFLSKNASLTTQQFKELTGLSRKFLIPLAELLDARKVTLRVGEARVLRKSS